MQMKTQMLLWESVLTDYLHEQRFGGRISSSTTTRRRTRLKVVPGASVSTTDTEGIEDPSSTCGENGVSDLEVDRIYTKHFCRNGH